MPLTFQPSCQCLGCKTIRIICSPTPSPLSWQQRRPHLSLYIRSSRLGGDRVWKFLGWGQGAQLPHPGAPWAPLTGWGWSWGSCGGGGGVLHPCSELYPEMG